VGGYVIQDIAHSDEPSPPEAERDDWYQFYFHTPRGRRALLERREELCRMLWRTWSPTWADADAAFALTAPSLQNPDFADVVIHSYEHRFTLAPGDPRYASDEARLALLPSIPVPTVVLDAGADGFGYEQRSDDAAHFTGAYSRRVVDVGHDLPQEAPAEFAAAVVSLL
jgi:pimeloyl-ACP methyl ester carboxylesterase